MEWPLLVTRSVIVMIIIMMMIMMMIITHRDGLCGVALADDGQRAGSGAHSAGGRRGEAENVGNEKLLRLVCVT